MFVDNAGLAITAAGEDAVHHYDQAIDDLLHFRAEVVANTDSALEVDPNFVMAGVLRCYLGLLSTDPRDGLQARVGFQAFSAVNRADTATERERAHIAVLQLWLGGDLHGSSRALRELAELYPRDALALAVGHQLDFFTGDRYTLRDRIGGALSAWSAADRHYPVMLGMYAFGLEESGHYDRSGDVGAQALEADPYDVWAIHAVTHTYEMRGRFGDGLRFLDERADNWAEGNFLRVHNWWHYSIFALEAQHIDRALEICDTVLQAPESVAVMEMLDAASLLWRLLLDGKDQPERWAKLVHGWAEPMKEPFYAFNDVHAVMSYVGSGEYRLAEQLIANREEWVRTAEDRLTNKTMTAEIGIPVAHALVAFGQANYARTIELLVPIRQAFYTFGGSHAQRDVLAQTLLQAALRAGDHDLARVLISERISLKPSSPYNWLRLAELANAQGHATDATAARDRAAALLNSAAVRMEPYRDRADD